MSPDPPVQDQDQDQDAAVLERELLNKHQAQVAQKILEDASKIKPDDGVDEWRHRAQEVVSESNGISIYLDCRICYLVLMLNSSF